MHRPGHVGLGLLSGIVFLLIGWFTSHPLWGIIALGFAIIGGTCPDMDQRLPIRHHGFSHTIACAILVGVPVTVVSTLSFSNLRPLVIESFPSVTLAMPPFGYPTLWLLFFGAFLTGYISHLLGDALSTASGQLAIKPYWPFSERTVYFGITTADNPYVNYGSLISGLLVTSLGIGTLVTLSGGL